MHFVHYSDKFGDECVPLLKCLSEKGNVTTYEWQTGEKPYKVEEPQIDWGLQEEEQQERLQESSTQEVVKHSNIHYRCGWGGGAV